MRSDATLRLHNQSDPAQRRNFWVACTHHSSFENMALGILGLWSVDIGEIEAPQRGSPMKRGLTGSRPTSGCLRADLGLTLG